jgi:hypothetical protein
VNLNFAKWCIKLILMKLAKNNADDIFARTDLMRRAVDVLHQAILKPTPKKVSNCLAESQAHSA